MSEAAGQVTPGSPCGPNCASEQSARVGASEGFSDVPAGSRTTALRTCDTCRPSTSPGWVSPMACGVGVSTVGDSIAISMPGSNGSPAQSVGVKDAVVLTGLLEAYDVAVIFVVAGAHCVGLSMNVLPLGSAPLSVSASERISIGRPDCVRGRSLMTVCNP